MASDYLWFVSATRSSIAFAGVSQSSAARLQMAAKGTTQSGELLVKLSLAGDRSSSFRPPSNEWDDLSSGELKHIFVYYSRTIEGIQMVYDKDGTLLLSPVRGSHLSQNFVCVGMKPGERIQVIKVSSAYKHPVAVGTYISSLTFETNYATYGPFGGTEGKTRKEETFSFDLKSGVSFAAFYGKSCSSSLLSLGIYVKTGTRSDSESSSVNAAVKQES